MNCHYHPTREAEAICIRCKNPICQECSIKVDDKTVCRHCLRENLFPEDDPGPGTNFWERLMFFCFSLIPGAAHMHMGLFRRGLELMIIVFGVIFLAGAINVTAVIPLVIVPTWFFSFFESHHLRRQRELGETLEDRGFFDSQLFDFSFLRSKNRLVGGTLLVLGLLGFMSVFETNLIYRLSPEFQRYYFLVRNSIIPLGLVLGGIYLLRKGHRPLPGTRAGHKEEIPSSDAG